MTGKAALLTIAALTAVGCGSATAPRSDGASRDTVSEAVLSRRICDGASGIRLAYGLMAGARQEPEYTVVLGELGHGFLFVDGRCHYWVQDPGTPGVHDEYWKWRSYREGQLTAAQETALHAAVSYDDPAKMPACRSTLAVAQGIHRIWDGTVFRYCGGNLTAEFDWPMRQELFSGGTPLQGAMRIAVSAISALDVPSDALIFPWPLTLPPGAIATQYSGARGQSKLIEDPSEAAALRALRDRAIADATETPGYFYGAIYVEPKGFVVAMRDHLPFTNPEDGLWSRE